jgi:hypothetical protein
VNLCFSYVSTVVQKTLPYKAHEPTLITLRVLAIN